MNTVIIIIKQPLERIPPIINLIDVSIELHKTIFLICNSVSDSLRGKYDKRVNFITFSQKRCSSKLFKIYNWLLFRYKVLSFLKSNKELLNQSILWVGSADAALAIGRPLFQFRYIFQCHELYDSFPFYHKNLKRIMQNAIINVNPNDDRGAIFRSLYMLNESPITLPNKPYYHPNLRFLNIEDSHSSAIINKLKSRKILLYQGGIGDDRDVSPIAEAIKLISDKWVLVLMGFKDKSSYLDDLLKKYPDIIYIPPLPAPFHLHVTSWARIGLVSYTFKDLNHVFCAPNKTWEFTGFGIPLLGNNVPGIINDLKIFHSGIYLDLQSVDSVDIADAIKEIDNNYNYYSEGALSFYNNINISETISYIYAIYENKLNM